MASIRNGKMFAGIISSVMIILVGLVNLATWPEAIKMFNDPKVDSMVCWSLSVSIVGFDVASVYLIGKIAKLARMWYRQFYRV